MYGINHFNMTEGKRQRQVAGVLQEALNDIFRRLELSMMDGGMVSISSVKVTPDLLEARIYLSLFQVTQPDLVMKTIESRAWEIKKELSLRVKTPVAQDSGVTFLSRRHPGLCFKMEELFKSISSEKPGGEQPAQPE